MPSYLIFTINYQDYVVQLTPEVANALPDLLTMKKASHTGKGVYKLADEKSDMRITIGEIEDGNN